MFAAGRAGTVNAFSYGACRLPLLRPGQAKEVWSMDLAFDRIATGRSLMCLVIVDDATHESIAVLPEGRLAATT